MRVAIMQPYLLPYAGYFCLMAAVDVFVIYDDCQYPKEGWVNRNQLSKKSTKKDWLTLPLLKKPLNTKINEIEWASNAAEYWLSACRKFNVFAKRPLPHLAQTVAMAPSFKTPYDFILRTLEMTRLELKFFPKIAYSSKIKTYPKKMQPYTRKAVPYPPAKGQDRVLQICEHYNATSYINASGGVDLYDRAKFRERGIKLEFLQPYEGNKVSILERLTFENAEDVRKEIVYNTRFI